MIEINLAKANKVRNYLADRIIPKLTAEVIRNQSVTFVGFETAEEMTQRFIEGVERIRQTIERRDEVVLTYLKLRKLIAFNNESKGVSELLTEIAFHEAELEFWNSVYRGVTVTAHTPEEIRKLMDYEKASATASVNAYRQPTRLSYAVFSETFSPSFVEEKVKTTEKKIRDLEETRNAKNYSVTITLDDEVQRVLVALDLI